MQYILSLLPVLACPLGMGLLMWFMMRSNTSDTDQAQGRSNQAPMNPGGELPQAIEPTLRGGAPQKPSVFAIFGMCLNWKVLVGLAVVGVLVLFVNPRIGFALVPLLLIAACPLSMVFMMRGMQRGKSSSTSSSLAHHTSAIEASREERLTALHTQLISMQAEQEVLASQITQLEREGPETYSHLEAEGETDTAINAERSQALPKW